MQLITALIIGTRSRDILHDTPDINRTRYVLYPITIKQVRAENTIVRSYDSIHIPEVSQI